MAELPRRRPPPSCFPWRELLRGCIPWLREAECGMCGRQIKRGQRATTLSCCGETFHQRCVEAWTTGGAHSSCPTCHDDLELCPRCPPPPPRP
ncbi:hypothetical protein GUJ93_ZPchr0002g24430 [Zizania palustris]|uniref:RING-type domain-containing protein n=1 Tax=Zizania palustris TaxID=103762 RepID=A0A8J5SI79_ZIZPA|nr:hypothetical protein GUJ93_ZPchr0002g24430 [Zizania palustris]